MSNIHIYLLFSLKYSLKNSLAWMARSVALILFCARPKVPIKEPPHFPFWQSIAWKNVNGYYDYLGIWYQGTCEKIFSSSQQQGYLVPLCEPWTQKDDDLAFFMTSVQFFCSPNNCFCESYMHLLIPAMFIMSKDAAAVHYAMKLVTIGIEFAYVMLQ